MEKIRGLLTSLILLAFVLLTLTAPRAEAEQPTAPTVVGEAAVLMDAQTGQILYQKNANEQMYPASTTKMLTALIALQLGELDETVTVSREASITEGSAIWLKEGEQLTLEDLLYALMLNSANDAAVAIAQHLAGSVEDFSQLMNTKAKEWGAKNSNFTNPHGLPDEQHYTTAYDLAVIARQAVRNKDFMQIAGTKTKTISRADPEDLSYLINHNRLLWNYEGTIGIKTGYTTVAQQCIVAAAQRDNRELIAVVLKTQGLNIWRDTTALLDYGFNHYQLHQLLDKGTVVGESSVKYSKQAIALIAGQDVYYNFPADHQPKIEKKINLNTPVAPIAKGQVLGQLEIYDGDQLLKTIDLLAGSEVKRPLTSYWWFWGGFAGWTLSTGMLLKRLARKSKAKGRRIRRRRKHYKI